jgi:hypothetical protein
MGKTAEEDSESLEKYKDKYRKQQKAAAKKDSKDVLLSWNLVNGGCNFKKVCYNTYGQMMLPRGHCGGL